MTEAEESERRQKEFRARTQIFMDALDVALIFAQTTSGHADKKEKA